MMPWGPISQAPELPGRPRHGVARSSAVRLSTEHRVPALDLCPERSRPGEAGAAGRGATNDRKAESRAAARSAQPVVETVGPACSAGREVSPSNGIDENISVSQKADRRKNIGKISIFRFDRAGRRESHHKPGSRKAPSRFWSAFIRLN